MMTGFFKKHFCQNWVNSRDLVLMSVNLLFLDQIPGLLGYKSIRSARRFCHNMDIAILSYPNSRKKFVLKADFDAALLRVTISHLQSRYGELQWESALNAHLRNDAISLIRLYDLSSEKSNIQAKVGVNGSKFLSDLKIALNRAKSK